MYQVNDMICILYIRDNKIGSIIPTVVLLTTEIIELLFLNSMINLSITL